MMCIIAATVISAASITIAPTTSNHAILPYRGDSLRADKSYVLMMIVAVSLVWAGVVENNE